MKRSMNKNVSLLTLTNALFFMANTIMISTSPLVGLKLAPSPVLATLPLGVQFLASMFTTMPASLLMRHLGRGRGLACGALFGIAAGLVGSWAITQGHFAAFVLAGALYGMFSAFCQYFRFAAADASDRVNGGDAKARAGAISWVLAGGIVAAFLGPELAKQSQDWLPSALFAGCYLGVAGLALCTLLVLLAVDLPPLKSEQVTGDARPLGEIFAQRQAIVAVAAAITGYVTMNLLMTATPLAMQHHGHLFASTAFVIQWHVVGMFAPSFFTGKLIARFGEVRIIAWGIAVLALSTVINLTGVGMLQFTAALITLGVGWNFTFIGGTTLLTRCYRPSEKAKAQGLNDLLLFSAVAMSATSSGALHQTLGWSVMNIGVMPALAFVMLLVLWPQKQAVKPA